MSETQFQNTNKNCPFHPLQCTIFCYVGVIHVQCVPCIFSWIVPRWRSRPAPVWRPLCTAPGVWSRLQCTYNQSTRLIDNNTLTYTHSMQLYTYNQSTRLIDSHSMQLYTFNQSTRLIDNNTTYSHSMHAVIHD